MNTKEAIQEIVKIIPEAEKKISTATNSFMLITVFMQEIDKMMERKDSEILIRSVEKMNEIYTNGDHELRNAVETVFVYALDLLTLHCEHTWKNLVFNTITLELRKVYLQQVYKSAI